MSSFAEDVEKFLELAKRKDGSLLEEKKKRREKASLTDKAAHETTRKNQDLKYFYTHLYKKKMNIRKEQESLDAYLET